MPELMYRALVSQSETTNPTVTVLRNDFSGVPSLSRYAVGAYLVSLVGAFPAQQTWLSVVKATLATITSDALFYRSDDDTLTLETQVDGVSSDGVLSLTSIEIVAYS